MKVSNSWLKDYIDFEMSAQELSDALTMAGLEVDSFTPRFEFLNTVVVGKIVEIEKHPNADKLSCCKVDTGDAVLNIVCGAPNAREGLVTPCALIGTEFPDGLVIKKSKLRGQKSEGMLCSASELGISSDHSGILELDEHLKPGSPVAQALDLDDYQYEIDLTPNRPDCLSLMGVAREIAAMTGKKITYPAVRLPEPSKKYKTIHDYTSIDIEDPDKCPRFTARLIFDVKVGPSPAWLADRLTSVGLNPINNIVDVTNFVMMETGQPLHAYDYDTLSDHRIVVKAAAEKETFVTLDGKKHELTSDNLMIHDSEKGIGIAGVMGGLNSEIEDTTHHVLLEVAYFDPVTVRKGAKLAGIGTDASHRFERGVDPENTLFALNRAAALIAELGSGELVEGEIDERPRRVENKSIEFSVSFINKRLGTSLSREEVIAHLESIEFEVEVESDDLLKTTPPSFRVDLEKPEDILEEIARLWGYNRIETTFSKIPAVARKSQGRVDFRKSIKHIISSFGFSETLNYSFIHMNSCDRLGLSEDDSRRNVAEILNPISEEMSVLRSSLIPGMLETMQRNNAKQVKDLRMFEVGNVFAGSGKNTQPSETEMIVCLMTGNRDSRSWHAANAECDFYDMKGVCEGIFSVLKLSQVKFTQLTDPSVTYLRKGHAAEIRLDQERLGILGEVDPGVSDQFNLKQKAFICELDFSCLMKHVPDSIQTEPIPKYPSVSRDLTLIVDRSVEASDILESIGGMDKKKYLMESIHLLDVYEGKNIPDHKKSLSFRVVYRSDTKTLNDKAVNKTHVKVSGIVIKKFDADLPA